MLTSAATAFVVHGGAIIPRRGITFKIGAEVVMARKLMEIGCPILYTVTGTGACEVGASLWLDYENWVTAVGAVDNNMEAVNQVRPILQACGVKDILTCSVGGGWGTTWGTEASWGHLSGYYETVDLGLGIAYVNGLEYSFLARLLGKGVDIIEVPAEERRLGFMNMTLIEPGKIIVPVQKMNRPKKTFRALNKRGVDVIEIEWDNMMVLGGGLHCALGYLVRDMPGPNLRELGSRKGKLISANGEMTSPHIEATDRPGEVTQ